MAAVSCHAVIPAAGIGARMGGDMPKQYLQVAGRSLLEHSLAALLDAPSIETVTISLHPQDNRAGDIALLQDARVHTVVGGEERVDSVLAALADLSTRVDPASWVLVHDAARPGLTPTDVERLVAQVSVENTGGILAEPVVDTVKRVDQHGRVLETLDRAALWRAQTPQMFALDELMFAIDKASAAGVAITDEASAIEYIGRPVQLVPGAAANLKVTVPADLELVAWYLERATREAQS